MSNRNMGNVSLCEACELPHPIISNEPTGRSKSMRCTLSPHMNLHTIRPSAPANVSSSDQMIPSPSNSILPPRCQNDLPLFARNQGEEEIQLAIDRQSAVALNILPRTAPMASDGPVMQSLDNQMR